MKKLFILLALFSFSFAAEIGHPTSGAGFKIGLAMANVRGDDVDALYFGDTKSKNGISVGAFGKFQMGDYFAIQPELLYSNKGTIAEYLGNKYTAKIDYFELPILFKLTIPTKSPVIPNFFVGPTGNLKLSAKYEYENSGITTDGDIEKVCDYDAGVTFGGGAEVDLKSSGSIIFDVRYYHGLIKLYDYDGPYKDNPDIYSNTLSINLGYLFKI